MKRVIFYAIILAMIFVSACRSDRTMCGKVHRVYSGY